MRGKFYLFLFLVIFCAVWSYAEPVDKVNISLDNLEVQDYKGQIGLWVNPGSKGNLYYYINKFGATYSQVVQINGANFTYGEYIFIPFSEKYIKELEESGKIRNNVASDKTEFIWPLIEVENISSTFGLRGRSFHTGADMPATRGTPILAVMDGRVISTRYDGGFGNTVIIEHRDGFYSRYAHTSVMLVKVGDYVKKGQVIAFVGSTGNSTGNHLHFEIRYNDIPLNPLDFLPIKESLKKEHMVRNWK